MKSLAELNLKIPTPKKNCLQHEWQAFAYKVWRDYCGVKSELPNMIRFHKQQQSRRNMLNAAYDFCSDYQGQIPKYKLFYWKFWQLYKSQQSPTGMSNG